MNFSKHMGSTQCFTTMMSRSQKFCTNTRSFLSSWSVASSQRQRRSSGTRSTTAYLRSYVNTRACCHTLGQSLVLCSTTRKSSCASMYQSSTRLSAGSSSAERCCLGSGPSKLCRVCTTIAIEWLSSTVSGRHRSGEIDLLQTDISQ